MQNPAALKNLPESITRGRKHRPEPGAVSRSQCPQPTSATGVRQQTPSTDCDAICQNAESYPIAMGIEKAALRLSREIAARHNRGKPRVSSGMRAANLRLGVIFFAYRNI
jgi:hypothetical protein